MKKDAKTNPEETKESKKRPEGSEQLVEPAGGIGGTEDRPLGDLNTAHGNTLLAFH